MIRVDGLHAGAPAEMRALRALWSSVLLQARKDIAGVWLHKSDSLDAPRTRARAEQWVRSTQKTPGTFEWVCVVLDLDVTRTREAMLAVAKRRKTSRKLAEVRV